MNHLKIVVRLASAAFLPLSGAVAGPAMLIGAILTVACSDGASAERPAGGTGGSEGGTSAGTGGGAGSALPVMRITCTETAPTTPVMCGGELCEAPVFSGNPCMIPCCIKQGDKEVCASKSTAMNFSTECVLPAVPDPQCPDIDALATNLALSMGIGGGRFKGCCNAAERTCGGISGIRPGCITESLLVTLPDLQACGEASNDGGTDLDGG